MFLRLSRVGVPDVLKEGHVFVPGKANVLREGTDVTLIANGVLTHRAVAAAELLAVKGVFARVLNMATVRPIDADAVIRSALETGAIVTMRGTYRPLAAWDRPSPKQWSRIALYR